MANKNRPRVENAYGSAMIRHFALCTLTTALLVGLATPYYSSPANAGDNAERAGKEDSVALGEPVPGNTLATAIAGFGIRNDLREQGTKSAVILWDEVLPSKPPKPGKDSNSRGNIRITINR